MKIETQITIEANEVTESLELYEKYMKESLYTNFDGIFSNVNTEAMCKEELNWSDEKIKRVFDGQESGVEEYRELLELAIKIQIAELDLNNEDLNCVSS